jgi:nucleoside-diphosphate-sugar epimerase/2-polyprenyl-3-methyl-5-hydroxy-6-metoxy-1,4-benzoquinol methylase
MKRIIITGGLGYIGTELCKLYSGESWYKKVIVIDKRFISERVNQLKKWNIEFLQGDILNINFLKDVLEDCDVVHHLAGITDVAYLKKDSNKKQDLEIRETAINGTNNILRLIRKNSKLIFPSTHVVFDGLKKTRRKLTEKIPPCPMLEYSKSKYQNEINIRNSGHTYIILRLGSVYGYSTDTARIKIMPNFFAKETSQNKNIKLFAGGKQLKSLVSLIDVARCFKFFEENEKFKNEVYNLSNENVSVRQVAEICKKINPKIRIQNTKDEIPNLGYTLSNKKLLKTGFNFLYNLKTSLKEMIENWTFVDNCNWLETSFKGSKNFQDNRGLISNYELPEPINLIGYISSKKDSVRANHYHPVQEQKCLLVKGQYISVIKNLLDKEEFISTEVFNEGQIIVTRPNVAHAMLFTKDSILLNLVRGEREHENYGITHTIKHILIDEKIKIDLLRGYKFECRCCKSNNLKRIISLGFQPLANNLLKTKNSKFKKYPLELNYCETCYNFQLSYVVNPTEMFTNYLYLSSTSESFRKHFFAASEKYVKKFQLDKKKSCILDIGSNDGIGLLYYKKNGFKNIYGIEPAINLASITKKMGIKTFNSYCNYKLLSKIKKKFDLITASNVFAHSDKIDEIVEFVKKSIKTEGIFIIEVQHVLRTLRDLSFDNIYHEHVNYWSIITLKSYLKKFDLKIFDVEEINTHGGSVRVYICNVNLKIKVSQNVNKIIKKEASFGIGNFEKLKEFSNKVRTLKENFNNNFNKLLKKKYKITFYGSPAKATTKLNYYGINVPSITTLEDNPLKANKYIPGVNVKILDKNKENLNKFDYIIVLAWNFFNEIKKNNKNNTEAKFLSITQLEN